jgi:hypothetical protein
MRLADSPSHPPGHIIFLGTGRVGVNRHRGHFGMTQPFLHQMKRNGFNPAFFEKNTQKTFGPAGVALSLPQPAGPKVFLLLFLQKKKLFPAPPNSV